MKKTLFIFALVLGVSLLFTEVKAQSAEYELPEYELDENYWNEFYDDFPDKDEYQSGGGSGSGSGISTIKPFTYVLNLDNLLSQINTNSISYEFDRNGAEKCPLLNNHIQGVAYYNNTTSSNSGYYYITRSRPADKNYQQLLIVNEFSRKVVNTLRLDNELTHPSGIQIYDTILVVPFNQKRTKIYSLSDPINPKFIDSIPYRGECAGITEYYGNYLVALFDGDRSTIGFYLLDSDLKIIKDEFNREKKIEWKVQNQDKSNWTPFKNWQGTAQHYEAMSLIKEQANSLAAPTYYLIMYHNDPEAIDVYSLSGLNFNNPPNLQMIRRIKVKGSGFRMGGGLHISSPNNIRFFSIQKRIKNKTRINIYYTDR